MTRQQTAVKIKNERLRKMTLQDVQEKARGGDFNAKAELYRRQSARKGVPDATHHL